MTIEFDIAGVTYLASKLDAFSQLHVSRKISPVLPKLMRALFSIFQKTQGGALGREDESGETKIDTAEITDLAAALEPVAAVLASMPDQDAEYVYSACLSVVSRKHGDTWSPVWNRQHSTCMYDDIDLGVMTQLVARVTLDSLGGFISGLLAKTGDNPQKSKLNGPQ